MGFRVWEGVGPCGILEGMDADELLSFFHTVRFDREWEALGFDDRALAELQSLIQTDPEAGDVLRNGAGIRKVRFARGGKGKSGGVRVCYLHILDIGAVLLACAYSKNKQANLSAADLRELRAVVDWIKQFLRGRKP